MAQQQQDNLLSKNEAAGNARAKYGDMTPRENMMAILEGRQPDYYSNFMESLVMIPDPVLMRDRCPADGQEHPDVWGTTWVRIPGSPGAHPHVTPENAAIKDIENWQEELTIPTVEGLDWTMAEEMAAKVDRKEKFVAFLCSAGLFERSHHLMGMEEAFCNYLEYPDEMEELLTAIADFKIAQIRETAKHIHPDVIFYHDDWGSKQNLFLPPSVWREMIKPQQQRISDVIHECGMLYVHHADCICQPIVEDMVEIGIDIWQGVIPENDIVEIQRITNHKLPMIGGIDGALLNTEGVTKEQIKAEIHRAIDTYCPGGYFYPALPNTSLYNAENDAYFQKELGDYGHQWAVEHPIK